MSVQIEVLLTNLLHQLRARLQGEQLIIQRVAASHHFHVVDEVGVDCRQTYAAVVHLPGKNFIPKEPVAEDAAV